MSFVTKTSFLASTSTPHLHNTYYTLYNNFKIKKFAKFICGVIDGIHIPLTKMPSTRSITNL